MIEEMGMTDKQFDAFLRSLRRQVKALEKANEENDQNKLKVGIAELLEDIEKDIND